MRDREVSDRDFERFLDGLVSRAPDVLSRVIVNDRLALAAAFPVAGVHLPEAGLPVAAVRSRFPRGRLLIGRSVHGLDAAAAAEADGADYVILGPVAPTGGKRPLPPEVFRETCRRFRIPVWVVGGLTPRRTSAASTASAPPVSRPSVRSVISGAPARSSPAVGISQPLRSATVQ